MKLNKKTEKMVSYHSFKSSTPENDKKDEDLFHAIIEKCA